MNRTTPSGALATREQSDQGTGNHTEDVSRQTGYAHWTEQETYTNVVCMERFLVRTEGGPQQGTFYTDETKLPWPLPDILTVDDGTGHYQKVRQSDLPPQAPDSMVMRGAEYKWVPDVPGEVVDASSAGAASVDDDEWVVGQEI
jgi:hypothetical protein